MNAYGQKTLPDAIKFSDQLFKVVDKGVISFEELASNLGSVNAVAAANKVEFKEVGAAFIELTRAGVSAAESETAIANLIRSIAGASPEAAAYAKSLGVELSDVALETKGLSGVMDELYRATGGAASVMDKMIPEARASKAALTLGKEGAEGFKRALDEMALAAGSTEKALSQQTKAASFSVNKLKIEAEALKGAFGEFTIKAMGPFIESLREGIKFLSSLSDETKETIATWAVFAMKAAGLGAIIITTAFAFTKIAGAIGALSPIIAFIIADFVSVAALVGVGGALASSLIAFTGIIWGLYQAYKGVNAAIDLFKAKAQNQIENSAMEKTKKDALSLTKEFHSLSDAQKESLKPDKLREYSQAFTNLITTAQTGAAKKYLREQAIGLEQMAKGLDIQAKGIKDNKEAQGKVDREKGRLNAVQAAKDAEAVEKAAKEAESKRKAAIEKQKQLDLQYADFQKDLAYKKATYNLTAFKKELFDINKARQEDLAKARTQGDKNSINAIYNKQVADATKKHNDELKAEKDRTDKEDQDRREKEIADIQKKKAKLD